MDLSGEWIDKVHQRKPPKQRILDLDSSVSETCEKQEDTAYNGHFECRCSHALFLFNQFGDLEYAMPRRGIKGNVVLVRQIEHLLTRPVGRPSHKSNVFYHSFQYQAKSWQRARRVVAKVTRHDKYVTFPLAELVVPRRLFAVILDRIARLAIPPPRVAAARS